MKINNTNFIDYTLLLSVIAVSGIPYFSTTNLYLPLFTVLFSVFLLRKKRLDWKFVLLLTFLVVITIVQTYVFSFYSIQTIVGLFLRVIFAYLIVKILEEKFIPYFINILYWMAIVSLIIHLPTLLVPAIGDMLFRLAPFFDILNFAGDRPTIVIYNIYHLGLRNSGPFWEPGAFAGYLILAYVFNFYSEDNNKKRKGMIFLISILTTLSTTAYLALFVFSFFVYYKKIKNVLIRIMAIFIILTGGYYAFTGLDFLGKKIESQMESAQTRGIEKSDNSQRFMSILRDMKDFEGHVLVGRGMNNFTRYGLKPGEEVLIRTVGLTDALVRVGLPFFLLMMYFLYRSICSYLTFQNHRNFFNCVGIFITILITLMSETYFLFPMYWSLLFLQFAYKKPKGVRSR